MANVAGGVAGGAQLLARQGRPSDALLLPADFPSLHPALTFSRHEVDALGGLRIVQRPPAHAAMNPQAGGAPHINGNIVIPDEARE
jgi:hypothetical protein